MKAAQGWHLKESALLAPPMGIRSDYDCRIGEQYSSACGGTW